jgi:hypothetical protein
LVWFVLFGLVWLGLVWFGLIWFGLVWFGLVRFGLTIDLSYFSEGRNQIVTTEAKHQYLVVTPRITFCFIQILTIGSKVEYLGVMCLLYF